MQAYIRSISRYAPVREVSNDELSKRLDTSDEWIYSHTGIKSRHIAAEGETTSDLGIIAAKRAIENAKLLPSDIDIVIVSTSTPDYIGGIPPTACVVQNALDIPRAGAMDINTACGGFVYALETARCYVAAKAARHVLVVCSEVYSKVVDWNDRSTCVLFGDGAGACVVSRTGRGQEERIFKAVLHSDGSGVPFLIRPAGGVKQRSRDEKDRYLSMNGRKVYHFAVQAIITMINEILETHSFSLEDIAYIVPHQANQRIVEAVAKREGIEIKKFFMNIERYANTASASIPIALVDMLEQNLLAPGDLVLAVSFGAGFVAGANLIRF